MYYSYPAFPQIPQSLVDDMTAHFEKCRPQLVPIENFKHFMVMPQAKAEIEKTHPLTGNVENSLGYPTSVAANQFPNVCLFRIIPAPTFVNTWLEKNIPVAGWHASLQEFVEGDFFIPHIDLMRDVAYNYLMDTGGEEVRTVFYKPRDEFKSYTIAPRTFIPYDRIQETDSIVFPKNKWHQLKVDEIHSVENLNPAERRFSLTLSMFNFK